MNDADRARKFHRRAQAAEGALKRVSFWINCLCEAERKGRVMGYVTTIAKYARSEIERGTKVDH